MKLDATYWQNRYLENDTAWDLGKASTPLKSIIDQLPDKNIAILVPGAGFGHEVRYLYDSGFKHVTVLDIAAAPLLHLAKQLPSDHPFSLVQKDFFDHSGNYDLILEQTFFCALELRFRESYFKQTHRLLKNNGVLTGLLFYFKQQHPGPPFTCSPEEYTQLAVPFLTIDRLEPSKNSEGSRQGKEYIFKLTKHNHGN